MGGPVRWNEANLNEIEADKPVRQKITEPKTPYPHTSADDGDDSYSPVGNSDEHTEAVRSLLKGVTSSSTSPAKQIGDWTFYIDNVDHMELDEERGNSSFKERRKAHYDEFRKVKEILKIVSLLDQEDDEEHDSEERNKPICNAASSSTNDMKPEETENAPRKL